MNNNSGEPFPNCDFYICISDVFIMDPDNLKTIVESSTLACPVICLKTEYYKDRLDVLASINHDFILITTCNDDLCVPFVEWPAEDLMKVKINQVLKNQHLKHWYTKNPCIKHPKIHPIPIGAKFQYATTNFFGEDKTNVLRTLNQYCLNPEAGFRRPKQKLLYFNYSTDTTDYTFYKQNTNIREINRNQLLKAGFPKNEGKPFNEYIQELSEYKFCASPPGRGIDTHRTWEAIMVGTIPIMIEGPLDDMFLKLPVVIVPFSFDWSTITEDWLNEKYAKLQERTDYDFSTIYTPYWKDKIRNTH